jgi:hypothetical protein
LRLVPVTWPSSHLLVNRVTRIIRVPAKDMTYHSTDLGSTLWFRKYFRQKNGKRKLAILSQLHT